MKVSEAINGVVDAAFERLEAERLENGILEGQITTLVRGDRTRPVPEPPAVFLFTSPATIDATTHGLAETWILPVVVAVLVKNEEPTEGYKEATDLAGLCMSALLGRNRKLDRNWISDVTASSFDPSGSQNSDQKRNLYWSTATVNVRFRRLDQNG